MFSKLIIRQTEKQGCQDFSAIAIVLFGQTRISCNLATLSMVCRLARLELKDLSGSPDEEVVGVQY